MTKKPVSYLHPDLRTCSYRTLKQVRDACAVRGGSLTRDFTPARLYTAAFFDERLGEFVKITGATRLEVLSWANDSETLNRPL